MKKKKKTFVHSILFPLSPFIVARIRNLDKDWTDHSKSTAITANVEMTSRDTGILVALYAVGLLCKIYKKIIYMIIYSHFI